MIDRIPPHSLEAEQACLGCVLLDPATALTELLSAWGPLGDEFYDLRHKTIYQAMCALWDERAPVDSVSLVQRLRDSGELDTVGGIAYITALPDVASAASGVDYFAEIVSEKASLRRLIEACTKAAAEAYQCTSDPEAIISAAEQAVMAVRKQRKEKTPSTPELVHQAIDEIERLHEQQGATGGITTGFSDIDAATDGLHPSEMLVIGGYPGSGKSTLAMNIVENIAIDSKLPVAIFSLEMSAKRLMMRMIASRGRVNLRSIRNGKMVERDFTRIVPAASALKTAPLHFCDVSDLTIFQLRAKARQMVQQHGIKLIVIDYLQLLTAPGKKDQTREQEVSTISRGVKLMALELEVPVIVLSQLNEDGKLRESRAIGQDADSVWQLRLKEGEPGTPDITPTQIEIKKQRDGEAPKLIDLSFLKSFTRFENASRWTPGETFRD